MLGSILNSSGLLRAAAALAGLTGRPAFGQLDDQGNNRVTRKINQWNVPTPWFIFNVDKNGQSAAK